jgi:hypothetical protein
LGDARTKPGQDAQLAKPWPEGQSTDVGMLSPEPTMKGPLDRCAISEIQGSFARFIRSYGPAAERGHSVNSGGHKPALERGSPVSCRLSPLFDPWSLYTSSIDSCGRL